MPYTNYYTNVLEDAIALGYGVSMSSTQDRLRKARMNALAAAEYAASRWVYKVNRRLRCSISKSSSWMSSSLCTTESFPRILKSLSTASIFLRYYPSATRAFSRVALRSFLQGQKSTSIAVVVGAGENNQKLSADPSDQEWRHSDRGNDEQ